MPKHATSTSFGKGNKASEGNDKTMRLSTWLEKELDSIVGEDESTLEGYEKGMQNRQFLARKLVRKAKKAKDDAVFKGLFAEIADRTEGKPSQSIDHTSGGEKIQSVLFVKPEKMVDEE